jgi:hypothetical protein
LVNSGTLVSAKRDAGCAVPIEDLRGRLLEFEDDPDLEGALEGIPGGRETGRPGADLEVALISNVCKPEIRSSSGGGGGTSEASKNCSSSGGEDVS